MSLSLGGIEGIIPKLQPILQKARDFTTWAHIPSKKLQIEAKIDPLHPAIIRELARWREWKKGSAELFEIEFNLTLSKIKDNPIPTARTADERVIFSLPLASPDLSLRYQAHDYLGGYSDLGDVQLNLVAQKYIELRKSEETARLFDSEVAKMTIRDVLHSQSA